MDNPATVDDLEIKRIKSDFNRSRLLLGARPVRGIPSVARCPQRVCGMEADSEHEAHLIRSGYYRVGSRWDCD